MTHVVAMLAFVLVVVATTRNVADAAPGDVTIEEAKRLSTAGDTEAALAVLGKMLEAAPGDANVLLLKARLLLDVRDWGASLDAYDAYLKTGPRGAAKRTAEKIVAQLSPVRNTKLELTVAGGATVYLDSKSLGVFCVAAPTCVRNVLPGDHRLILEREGHQKVNEPVIFEMNKTLSVNRTMTESPSAVTVGVVPSATKVTVDGKLLVARDGGLLPPGRHELVATLPGHVDVKQSIVAAKGAAINLKIVMQVAIPVSGLRPNATVELDGVAAKLEQGQLRVASDGIVHRYRIVAVDCATIEGEIPAAIPAGFVINGKQVKTKVRLLTSATAAKNVTVTLDAKAISIRPSSVAWDGAPGQRTIVVQAPGVATVSKVVTLDEDMVLSIESKRSGSNAKLWWGIGATATFAVAGSTLGYLALNKQRAYDRLKVMPQVDADSPALKRLQTKGDRFALLSDISIAGAILGVGFVSYVWLTSPERASSLHFQLTPSGAAMGGAF